MVKTDDTIQWFIDAFVANFIVTRPTACIYITPLKQHDALSNKRSLFTHPSQCYFSSLPTALFRDIPPINSHSLEPHACTDLMHCQMIWNIIWSCLIMVFSCTWVAVHPNILCPRERKANSCIERWYGIHWCHLPSIALHFLSAHCLCLSTFSLGQ